MTCSEPQLSVWVRQMFLGMNTHSEGPGKRVCSAQQGLIRSLTDPGEHCTLANRACKQVHAYHTLLQVLAEKKVTYTPKYVDLFNGQSLSPQYLAINPNGTVPVLVDGDKVISDSRCVSCAQGTYAPFAIGLQCV